MEISKIEFELATLHDKSNYQVDDLESEIYVDQLCSALLKNFHQHLLQNLPLDPLEAGSRAAGADYFLREFMVGKKRENIFSASADRIEQFAGNWYIISTLEPNISELSAILAGTASFYRYCADHGLADPETVARIEQTCGQTDYFRQRIEEFHAISGDGYAAWNRACPL